MRTAAGEGIINVWLISLDALFTARYELIQAGTTRQDVNVFAICWRKDVYDVQANYLEQRP